MSVRELEVPDAERMGALGARLARRAPARGLIWLQGQLGAGKTTLVRGLIRALGYSGTVRSPTYTLVEPYLAGAVRLYHIDCYRLTDPQELEDIGLRDYLGEEALCVVEWPEHGQGVLPEPDLLIRIEVRGEMRRVHLEARTSTGGRLLSGLDDDSLDRSSVRNEEA